MKIGASLKFWRENRNFTYYRMAQESGIDADYIKKIEESTEDNEPNIKIETLERLANALGIPPSDLVEHSREAVHLTEKEEKLVTIFRRFEEEAQDALLNMLDLVSKK